MKVARTVFIALISIAFTSTNSLCSELAAKAAKGITVRIEGATQGSGVIVNQEGNTYTVLTAWHVLKSNQPGEEISIYTEDGLIHISTRNQSKQISELDLGSLTFTSPKSYQIAEQGNIRQIKSGGDIFVAGFPLPSTAIPVSILRFLSGRVIANALGTKIPKGYELLYDNQTLPGMSGGAVLTKEGKLVGIHGQGETDSALSIQSGVAVKTGTNQAIPITYWKSNEKKITGAENRGIDSLLAKIISLNKIPGPFAGGSGGFREPFNGYEDEIIKIANKILQIDPKNYIAYNLRGGALIRKPPKSGTQYAKISEKWYSNYRKGIENTNSIHEARVKYLKDLKTFKTKELLQQASGLSDLKVAEVFNPNHEPTLENLFETNRLLGNNMEALNYLNKLVNIDKKYLIDRSYHILTKLPERELIGCQDLYRSAEHGDETAIYEISSSRFTDYNSSEKCKKYELELNINTAKMRLEEYDTNIRSWERKYNFKSSYEAEETFSRANWKTDKNDEFYKNGKSYIQMRFTRGALKQLLGIREGTCRDINSFSGWGSNIQWIKYRWGYYNNVCPKS